MYTVSNSFTVLAPHPLSPLLGHQQSPHWKLRITHVVFGINFLIHFISLISRVPLHLIVLMLSSTFHPHHCHHSLLLLSFTRSIQAENVLLPRILPTTACWYHVGCLHELLNWTDHPQRLTVMPPPEQTASGAMFSTCPFVRSFVRLLTNF